MKPSAASAKELKEAREQHAATAEILKVIARSPDDVQPVFEVIADSAKRLLGGLTALVTRVVDDELRAVAIAAGTTAGTKAILGLFPAPLSSSNSHSRAATSGRPIIRNDIPNDPEVSLQAKAATAAWRFRSQIVVPMLREGKAIGTIGVARAAAGKFTIHQVELLKTFADQAVIAIENARLFNETKEALAHQTASAEVLQVIGKSMADARPVFERIVDSLERLFDPKQIAIFLLPGDGFVHLAARRGMRTEAMDSLYPQPVEKTAVQAVLATGQQVCYPDVAYGPNVPQSLRRVAEAVGNFSDAITPLLWKGRGVGMIAVTREPNVPFSERELSLLRTFADQAVIAIENARLFGEVQAKTANLTESLQRQTATADVLKIISRSVAHAAPVFEAILESCQRLFNPYYAAVYLLEGDELRDVARRGPGAVDWVADSMLLEGSSTSVAIAQRRPVHFPDLADKHDLPEDKRATVRQNGGMTVLHAPMISQDSGVGLLVVTRRPRKPFTEAEIAFIQTFADQAAIAIENVRLFESVEARTRELSASLEELRTTQDRLVETQKLASLGQLTAGIAHEIKNPLNFVNNFSALSAELVDEMTEVFENPALDETGRRKELDEIRGLLKSNLEKVVQHGKRADSIVKNMLLHSREGSGERRSANINGLVEESLNLAYHGARAEKAGFNITLRHDLDPDAGAVELYPQEITRALLNLISNGFYAAIKRKAETGDYAFEPVLSAATRNLGRTVEIRIRDNGTGIPPEVREKMFNPFFTTKPTGEGTGLGLSMSHDIVVKQHRGKIDVETKPGEFTEFIITLPRDYGAAGA